LFKIQFLTDTKSSNALVSGKGLSILGAIKDVLGEAATEDVLNAWKEAYFFLADILIARETELYAQA